MLPRILACSLTTHYKFCLIRGSSCGSYIKAYSIKGKKNQPKHHKLKCFFSDNKSSKQTQHFMLISLGYADTTSTATEVNRRCLYEFKTKQIHTEVRSNPHTCYVRRLVTCQTVLQLTLVLIDLLTR